MYLPDEKCMNPYATVSCLECGACGREFEHGHITIGGRTCATCAHYDSIMSECDIKSAYKFLQNHGLSKHAELFVHKNDTCDKWKDAKE